MEAMVWIRFSSRARGGPPRWLGLRLTSGERGRSDLSPLSLRGGDNVGGLGAWPTDKGRFGEACCEDGPVEYGACKPAWAGSP